MSTLLERLLEAEKRARESGLSGRAWCRKAGVSTAYWSTLKARLRENPNADGRRDELVKLARAAGVDPGWLLGEQEERAPVRHVVVDDDYPNRHTAWVGLRSLWPDTPAHRAALESLRSMRASSGDMTVSDWVREAEGLLAVMRGAARREQELGTDAELEERLGGRKAQR